MNLRQVEQLSALQLTEEERAKAEQDLREMVGFFDEIRNADLPDTEYPDSEFSCPLRPDEIKDHDGRPDTLSNAPERKGDFFVVPKTITSQST